MMFNSMGSSWRTSRRRWMQAMQDANDQQPWRCVACNEAVSHIRRNDCACLRVLRART
jgi:hypothetical protein